MSSKDQMFAKVILASRPTNGAPPIITIHAHYPRMIHSEVMTHRVFSRNARSSRAVPVATMLKEIRENPVVPWHWGKNQKGMQASEECNEKVFIRDDQFFDTLDMSFDPISREKAWLWARDQALTAAEGYAGAGYHKQVANRLLEPFMWIDTLITSTSWANFFHLRDHDDAEPHFHDLAAMIREAIAGAEYQTLEPGQWHLPYVDGETGEMAWRRIRLAIIGGGEEYLDGKNPEGLTEILKRVSVARCARISYAPFDGDGSIERELERYDNLVGSDPLHASPAEHQATPDVSERVNVFDNDGHYVGRDTEWLNPGLAGNLGEGWIQYRKTLPGEYVAD